MLCFEGGTKRNYTMRNTHICINWFASHNVYWMSSALINLLGFQEYKWMLEFQIGYSGVDAM